MRYNLFEPDQTAYFMGKLYRVIWSTRDQVKLQLVGTHGPGMTRIGGTIQSFEYNQVIAPISHWSLYLA